MPPSGNRYNIVPSNTSRVHCRSDVIAPTALGAPFSEQPQAIEGNGHRGSHVGERVEIREAGAGDTMPGVSMARIDPL